MPDENGLTKINIPYKMYICIQHMRIAVPFRALSEIKE